VKIVIASSISGGHLFPAIALAGELKKADPSSRILFISGEKKVAERILNHEDYPFILLEAFPKTSILNLAFVIVRFLKNIKRSFSILKSEKPDAVVGFGGLASAPVLLASRMLGIPSVIHEQNMVFGRTNMILAHLSDKVAISFKETRDSIKLKSKVVYTGNPIRSYLGSSRRDEAIKGLGFDPGNFTLFVMGGSQGAHSINRAVIKFFEMLTPDVRKTFQAVHIAGDSDCKMVLDKYKTLGVTSRVFSFMEKIDSAYSASDLIVSRAGASAIFEINSLGKAAVLVPYPHARLHQAENAAYLAKRNMAVLVNDDEALPERLHQKIMNFYNDKEKTQAFTETQKLERNAARNMVNLIMKVTGHEK